MLLRATGVLFGEARALAQIMILARIFLQRVRRVKSRLVRVAMSPVGPASTCVCARARENRRQFAWIVAHARTHARSCENDVSIAIIWHRSPMLFLVNAFDSSNSSGGSNSSLSEPNYLCLCDASTQAPLAAAHRKARRSYVAVKYERWIYRRKISACPSVVVFGRGSAAVGDKRAVIYVRAYNKRI